MRQEDRETADRATGAFHIRRCTAVDAAALALVGQATFLDTFAGILNGRDIVAHCARQHAQSVYEAWLEKPTNQTFLAETLHGAPIGYLVLDASTLPVRDPAEGDYELKRIYLLHRFHGGGAGQALMTRAIETSRELGKRRLLLGVYGENARALAFYAKNGFRVIGERQFQVGESHYQDAVMARTI